MYSSYQALRIVRDGTILTVTIDNPPVNAITPLLHRELSRVFHDIALDAATRVVILTGGGEAFSAGGDLANMLERVEGNRDSWHRTVAEAKEILLGLLDLPQPVIARVNGHAIGLGATLAAFSDISVMVETARIADPHVRIGLVAGDGGALMWPLLIGLARARELLLTGDALTGREAAEIGLINRAVPANALDATVAKLATKLADGAPRAIAGTKRALNLLLRPQAEALIDKHLALETGTVMSEDHREAVLALRDKRCPRFVGR